MKREPAWRVFAGEFNDTTYEEKGEGEMTPSFIITPLGAKINRLYVVGVLTDVEHIGESGDLVRAHLSDPTGVFTLYSGQYQPEATEKLSAIEVPAFVAVVGKARTYEPEPGTMIVSIRPETIQEVSTDIRDQWILQTCQHTKQRIVAMQEAKQLAEPSISHLKNLGCPTALCQGIMSASTQYPTVDIQKYVAMIRESLEYLGPKPIPTIHTKKKESSKPKEFPGSKPSKISSKDDKKTKESSEKTQDAEQDSDNETVVLQTIKDLEDEEGAAWDDIITHCQKKGLDEPTIEEALSALMDKGLVYEPILGTIKTT